MVSLLFCLILGLSEAGYVFLTITPGSKAVSMGSAFTALSDDATCVYYNPAALAFADRAEVSSMNMSFPGGLGRGVLKGVLGVGNLALDTPETIEQPWLPGLYAGMRYMYFGTASPLGERDGVGIGYTYITTGETVATDEYGNEIARFTNYDYAVSLSYGRQLWEGLSVGTSLKYIYSFLCPSWLVERFFPGRHGRGYGQNIALDLGVMYRTPIPGISIGASYQNFGREVSYVEGESSPLPKLERRGISIQPMEILDSLNVTFRGINPADYIRYTFTCDLVNELVGGSGRSHSMFYCRGNELTLFNIFSYRWGYFEDRVGVRVGKTEGYGINLGLLEVGVAEDSEIYSFPTENWRVQVNFTCSDKTEFASLRDRPILNAGGAILSSLVVPGGGQLYNGESLKGLLLLSGAFCLAEYKYRKGGTLPTIGLLGLYGASLGDVIYALGH